MLAILCIVYVFLAQQDKVSGGGSLCYTPIVSNRTCLKFFEQVLCLNYNWFHLHQTCNVGASGHTYELNKLGC